jgi:hypothetical protein
MTDTDNKITSEVEVVEAEIVKDTEEEFIKAPSPMLRAFTRFFIEQGFENAAEAARRAGTTAKNPNHIAWQWLQDPWVKREIERAKELIDRGENPLELIREEDVVTKLLRIYDECMNNRQYTTALNAVALMGKQIGMFNDKMTFKNQKAMKQLEQDDNIARINELSKLLVKNKEVIPSVNKEIIPIKPEE